METAVNNIVHENETQRQYVRVSFPARARINDKDYTIVDLSSGGMSVEHFNEDFSKGKRFDFTLIFPFETFSLDVKLEAEARHVNIKENTAGFRFTNLSSEQTSILNHILRSFIAGEIVSSKDILAVVSRDNFVKVRQHGDVESDRATFWKRQAVPFFFIALLGLSAFYIIAKNIYMGVFVVQSSQGFVSGNEINIRTPLDGVFIASIDNGATSVQSEQLIGNIRPFEQGVSSNTGAVVKSPCDCIIISQNVGSGEFITKGSKLLTLAKRGDTPWITAVISTQEAQRILLEDEAKVLVAGQDVEIKGIVKGFSVNQAGGPVVAAADGFDTGVRVRVELEQKIPVELIGRPARIFFNL